MLTSPAFGPDVLSAETAGDSQAGAATPCALGGGLAVLQDEGDTGIHFPSTPFSQQIPWVTHLGGQPHESEPRHAT